VIQFPNNGKRSHKDLIKFLLKEKLIPSKKYFEQQANVERDGLTVLTTRLTKLSLLLKRTYDY
jgi:hypothetical protein